MRKRLPTLFLLLLLQSLGRTANAEVPTVPPGSPETYLAQGKATEFIRLAKEFLKAQPQSEQAPRVAWQWFQVVGMTESYDEVEWRAARLRLLGDYPASLPAQFLFAQMSAREYDDFLETCFGRCDLQSDPKFLERFSRAAELGFKRFGPRFGGTKLILQAALATEDKERRKSLLGQFGLPEVFPKVMANIILDDSESGREKCTSLKGLGDFKIEPAFSLLWVLYQTKLTPEEAAAPEIGKSVAVYLLEEGLPGPAAQVLAKVCDKHADPKLLYQWAIADASSGNAPRATETLRRLVKEYPPGPDRSPWAASAEKLIPVLAELDKNLVGERQILGEIADSIGRSPPEVLELTLEGQDEDLGKFSAYAACDVRTEMLEALVQSGGTVICAFKTSADDNRSYLLNDARIRKYEQRAFPIPQFDIATKPSGRGKFTFGLALNETGWSRFQHFMDSRLSSPLLTKAKVRDWITDLAISGGAFPGPLRTEAGEKVLPVLFLSWKEPDITALEVRVGEDHHLAVKCDDITLRLRYGCADQIVLKSPPWPDMPIEHLARCDFSEIMRLGGGVMELVANLEKDDVENIAEGKKNPKR